MQSIKACSFHIGIPHSCPRLGRGAFEVVFGSSRPFELFIRRFLATGIDIADEMSSVPPESPSRSLKRSFLTALQKNNATKAHDLWEKLRSGSKR
jgi:hypothetical protein